MLAELRHREYRLFAANVGVVTGTTPQDQADSGATNALIPGKRAAQNKK